MFRFGSFPGFFHFADVAVATRYNGKPTLMIRVGNGRLGLLVDAQARITVGQQGTRCRQERDHVS